MSLFDLLEGGGSVPPSTTSVAAVPSLDGQPASIRNANQRLDSDLGGALNTPESSLPVPLQKVAAGFAPTTAASRLQQARDSPFALDPVDVESRGPGPWTALAVANNVLIVAQDSPPKCLRIYLDGSKELDEIELELPKKPAGPVVVRSIFLDPTARHAILHCGPDLTFFLGATTKRARLVTKIKGTPTCIAWNRASAADSTSTGAILLGMADSTVWEAHFEHVDESSGGFFGLRTRTTESLKFAKQIATLPDPPTFIQFDPFPIDERKFAITVATIGGKLIQFIGKLRSPTSTTASGTTAAAPSTAGAIEPGALEQVLNTRPWTLELPPVPTTPLLPVSVSRPVYAGLQLGAPTKLAWLSASGVYAAPISFGSQASADTLFDHPQLYALAESVLGDQPRAIVSLQFHFILIGTHSACAVSSLVPDAQPTSSSASDSSDQLPTLRTVWSARFPSAPVLGVAHDLAHNTVWAITASELYELTVKDEDRDIWRFYLAQNKFELALTHAKSKQQRDLVAKAQADHYFESKRYVLSAKYYAQAAVVPFEQVTLQFIERGEMEALRAYLGHVLDAKTKGGTKVGMGKEGPGSVEATMIAMWLFELLLEHLNEPHVDEQEKRILEASVRDFIAKYHAYLEKRTVGQLCASYNRDPELLHFYVVTHDHANILQYWIDRQQWDSALVVLERQIDPDMFYRFVPLLLDHAPARIAQILIAKSKPGHTGGAPSVDVVPLIGAFIKSPDTAVHKAAIPLIEHAVLVMNRTESVLHNYLVQLYARYGGGRSGGTVSGATTPKSAVSTGDGSSSVALLAFLQAKPRHYHVDHALRVCHASGCVEATIYLLTELDRVAQAVELALERGNVSLAMELAKDGGAGAASKDEVREHWLAIVKHLVEGGEIGRVLRMVRGSQVLRLEDVLELLPEVSNMDDFRDDLVAVLEDYTQELTQLETNMDATFKSLEDLQRRATSASAPIARVDPSGPCAACHQPLMPASVPSTVAGVTAGMSAVSLSASGGGGALGGTRSVAASQRSGAATSVPGGMVGVAQQQPVGGGWMAFGCGHVVHAIPCARSGAADCPVCGEVLLHDLDVPLFDPLDRSWAID